MLFVVFATDSELQNCVPFKYHHGAQAVVCLHNVDPSSHIAFLLTQTKMLNG